MTRIVADWLTAPATIAVMRALNGPAFFVGGCVRNALLGEPVADIDVATPLEPEEVIARLEGAGLRAVPTGLQHGTVTAIALGQPIEVTTFRTDEETDGRRAVVRFTAEIAEDAARRDFTMNALYADAAGEVIDPLGGLPDLAARRVRFINDPHDRIREDYLRILRFFRFFAWYGGEGIDAEGLAACAELADGLEGLARERIGWEVRKLLAAPDPAPAVAAMAAAGILQRCLPGADPSGLAPLVDAEARAGAGPDWITRLAALGEVEDLVNRLRLSREEAKEIEQTRAAMAEPRPAAAAFLFGAVAAWRASLIRAAMTGGDPTADADAIERGSAAEFPLAAADLIAAGVAPGPSLGRALSKAREAWVDSGFSLDRASLLREADESGPT